MKNTIFLIICASLSVVALIGLAVYLLPLITIGLADDRTQLTYYLTVASLGIFALISLFLTNYYKKKSLNGELPPQSTKRSRLVVLGFVLLLIVTTVLSFWNLTT